MSSVTRDGYILDIINNGLTTDNVSLNRRSGLEDTKITDFGTGFIEYIKYYGNELTWEQLAMAKLQWGSDTKIRFSTLKDGWTYVYKCRESTFMVTDDKNAVQFKIKTSFISKFGITWDIFTSRQFYILYANPPVNEWFLNGWKWPHHLGPIPTPDSGKLPDKPPSPQPNYDKPYLQMLIFLDILAMWGDKYYLDDVEYSRNWLWSVPEIDVLLENQINQDLLPIDDLPTFLRANTPAREHSGNYSAFMLKKEDIVDGAADKRRDGSIVIEQYMTWLLSLLSVSLYNRGNPVYEPWMLWWLWQWLGEATPLNTIDKIFDIMPNWSD